MRSELSKPIEMEHPNLPEPPNWRPPPIDPTWQWHVVGPGEPLPVNPLPKPKA